VLPICDQFHLRLKFVKSIFNFCPKNIQRKFDYAYSFPATFRDVNQQMVLCPSIFSFFRLYATALLFMIKINLFAYGNALNNGRRFI